MQSSGTCNLGHMQSRAQCNLRAHAIFGHMQSRAQCNIGHNAISGLRNIMHMQFSGSMPSSGTCNDVVLGLNAVLGTMQIFGHIHNSHLRA
ncbi:hypothetical protein KY284_033585 [Solanum tuberosum]|nr:hypothetical protein KY284_033585 [Solanum tuberosum]